MKQEEYIFDPYSIGPLELLIVQATPFCNIDCKYCYLSNRKDVSVISLDVILKSLERIIQEKICKDSFTLVWHAGEPTIVSPKIYRRYMKVITNSTKEFVNINFNFQTNGTLLTQEWCDLFLEFKCEVVLSIDGPEEIHDFNRVTRNNKGTFKKVMEGVDLLNKNNIPYSVISVLSSRSLIIPEKIFHFFYGLGVKRVGFNIEETEGVNMNSSVINRKYFSDHFNSFWEKMIKLWYESDRTMEIRELKFTIEKIVYRGSHRKQNQVAQIYKIISIDTKGNFSTFSPELLGVNHEKYGDFLFGNVYKDSFREAILKPKFEMIHSEITLGVKECSKTCDYFNFCAGGCPSNKLWENQSFNSTTTSTCHYQIKMMVDTIIRSAQKLESKMPLVNLL